MKSEGYLPCNYPRNNYMAAIQSAPYWNGQLCTSFSFKGKPPQEKEWGEKMPQHLERTQNLTALYRCIAQRMHWWLSAPIPSPMEAFPLEGEKEWEALNCQCTILWGEPRTGNTIAHDIVMSPGFGAVNFASGFQNSGWRSKGAC